MKKFVFVLLIVSVIFGCVSESDPLGIETYPKQCSSQTGGYLLIKDFDFNENTIKLRIQNTTPFEVTINSFTGNPLPISWQNAEDATLLRTDSKTFTLKGTFTGQLNEEISIKYTANGETKTEKTTCTGTIK